MHTSKTPQRTVHSKGAVRVFLMVPAGIVRQECQTLIAGAPDLRLVGAADTGAEAMARIPVASPDVVIVSLDIPDKNGIEICRAIRDSIPSAACVVLATDENERDRMAAIEAGASACLRLATRGDDLVAAVHAVAGGLALLDPGLVDHMLAGDVVTGSRAARGGEARSSRMWAHLTDREAQVLALVAHGHTDHEIEERLLLSRTTVKSHLDQLLRKEGARSRTQLALRAAHSLSDNRVVVAAA
jgi:two-component system, NarL family, response regulator DevR